jgi:hypothetical protein
MSIYACMSNASGRGAGALIDWRGRESTLCPMNVERVLKKFKMHRCATVFDTAFYKVIFT